VAIFAYPLAATRALAPMLVEVDPSRRVHVASRIVFADWHSYSDAEAAGIPAEDFARSLYLGNVR
jgi:hypothetical protein